MKSNFNLISTSAFYNAMSKVLFTVIALTFSTSLFSQTIPTNPTGLTATPDAVCSGVGEYSILKAYSTGNTIKWYTVTSGGSSIGSSSSGGSFLVYPGPISVYYAESWSPSNIPSAGRTAITVTLNTAPYIVTMPADINTTNEVSQCGRVITFPNAIVTGTPTPSVLYSSASGTNFNIGTTTDIVSATNVCGDHQLEFDVTVIDNEAPVVITPPSISVSAPSNSLSVIGIDLGTPVVTENCGSVTIENNAPAIYYGGITTITWTVADEHGNVATATQTVTVTIPPSVNTPPVIGTITTNDADNIIAQNTSATLNINWTDNEAGGPYSVDIDWRDSSSHTIVNGISGLSCSRNHTYNKTGVFSPIVKVTDGGNASTTTSFKYLVVYVVGNYFTTSEGEFTAPAGSLVSNPTLSSSRRKVEIGVECKPKQNHPGDFDGEMEFEMDGGHFEFETEKIDWNYLAVSACFLATFQGTGYLYPEGHNNNCDRKCHGSCNSGHSNQGHQYGILIVQSDKTRNSINKNKIRIKIWDITAGNAVVFDTQMGQPDYALPTTALTEGSVKVKVPNNCVARPEDATVYYNGTFETAVYPNPFTANFKINVSTISESPIQVEIFDMVGKLVQNISDVEPNEAFNVENNFPTGMYFIRISQDGNSQTVKMIKNNQ